MRWRRIGAQMLAHALGEAAARGLALLELDLAHNNIGAEVVPRVGLRVRAGWFDVRVWGFGFEGGRYLQS